MTQLHVPEAVRLPEQAAQAQSPVTQTSAVQPSASQLPQAASGQISQDAPAPPGLPQGIAQGIPQGVAIQGTAMGFPEQLSMHPMIMAGGLGLVVLLVLTMIASNIRRRRMKLECRRINALSAQFSGSR